MRKSLFLLAMATALIAGPTAALAKVKATVNLSKQRITVAENGVVTHTWKISSGKRAHITPNGSFKPTWVKKMHYSKQYNNSPMPYTVFFHRGYAIHGTNATWRLGTPASHGCVRLHTANAKKFYDIVKKHGQKNVTIKVVGTTKFPKRRYVKKRSTRKNRAFSWNNTTTRSRYRNQNRYRTQRSYRNKNRYRTQNRRTARHYDDAYSWF